MTYEREKEAAARASLRFVKEGDVVGLGSGTTATHFVRLLGEYVKGGLRIRGVPTSVSTQDLARSLGIPLVALEEVREIDVTIDGADEVDPSLRLIKGRGGALLHEKVVASASRRLVILVDHSKLVPVLGKSGLPIEVIAFAEALVRRRVEALGASVAVRQLDGAPYITDEGHHIFDCFFGPIGDPPSLARSLSDIPGVVGHGLFIDLADVVLVAKADMVTELRSGHR